MTVFTPIKQGKGLLVNPMESTFSDHCFRLDYMPDVTYYMIADNLEDALDVFGEYCKEYGLTGFISEEQEEEEDFPVNGGEYWLQVPSNAVEVEEPTWSYTITYQTITPESAEQGDFAECGEEDRGENATFSDLLDLCQEYGLVSCKGAAWLYNIDPVHDIEYFERGEEKFYGLHISGQDHNNKEILKALAKIMK